VAEGVFCEAEDADASRVDMIARQREATEQERAAIRGQRRAWLETDPEVVARGYKSGELDTLDVVRRYAVILDWSSGEVLPHSTAQFRDSFRKRTAAHWRD